MDGKYSPGAMIAITLLRVFVGWHFLYEGLTKLTSAGWWRLPCSACSWAGTSSTRD